MSLAIRARETFYRTREEFAKYYMAKRTGERNVMIEEDMTSCHYCWASWPNHGIRTRGRSCCADCQRYVFTLEQQLATAVSATLRELSLTADW
jgi:hypothetical protein